MNRCAPLRKRIRPMRPSFSNCLTRADRVEPHIAANHRHNLLAFLPSPRTRNIPTAECTTVFPRRGGSHPAATRDPCFEMEVRGSRYHDKIWFASPDRSRHLENVMHGESAATASRRAEVLLCQGQLLHAQAFKLARCRFPNRAATNSLTLFICVGARFQRLVLGVQHSPSTSDQHTLPSRNRFFAHAALHLEAKAFRKQRTAASWSANNPEVDTPQVQSIKTILDHSAWLLSRPTPFPQKFSCLRS